MKVGDGIKSDKARWSFQDGVAESFVQHITRSVPYYADGHDLVCFLSDYFVGAESTVYELGCSTGELLRKLATYNRQKPGVQWVGIDDESSMIEVARQHCAGISNIELHRDDIVTCDYQKADLVVAYYTVQFLPERHRQALINRIYQALNWGGGFIFFEKVGAPDSRFQDMMTGLYRDFKQRRGFSAEEILNKESSLKGVLRPFSTQGNLDLLRRAGFVDCMSVMKYVCFEGFLAIK